MRRPRKRYPGAKYHVTNRGNGRAKIFYHDGDRARFMEQLQEALRTDGVVLYAYCLLSNHFHLLVETPRANIDQFMARLETAYAMYFRYANMQCANADRGSESKSGRRKLLLPGLPRSQKDAANMPNVYCLGTALIWLGDTEYLRGWVVIASRSLPNRRVS